MPSYDHHLVYRHNYFLFYQSPNSNLSTHRMLFSREKPPMKTMAPGSIFIILIFQHLVIFIAFYFTLHLYHKNTKNIILSYLSDLTLVSDRVRIDNPSYVLGCKYLLFVCRYHLHSVAWFSYWIDTLVLKNWGKYLHYSASSPFPLQGKTSASAQEVA